MLLSDGAQNDELHQRFTLDKAMTGLRDSQADVLGG